MDHESSIKGPVGVWVYGTADVFRHRLEPFMAMSSVQDSGRQQLHVPKQRRTFLGKKWEWQGSASVSQDVTEQISTVRAPLNRLP